MINFPTYEWILILWFFFLSLCRNFLQYFAVHLYRLTPLNVPSIMVHVQRTLRTFFRQYHIRHTSDINVGNVLLHALALYIYFVCGGRHMRATFGAHAKKRLQNKFVWGCGTFADSDKGVKMFWIYSLDTRRTQITFVMSDRLFLWFVFKSIYHAQCWVYTRNTKILYEQDSSQRQFIYCVCILYIVCVGNANECRETDENLQPIRKFVQHLLWANNFSHQKGN